MSQSTEDFVCLSPLKNVHELHFLVKCVIELFFRKVQIVLVAPFLNIVTLF
jgi:hypothetical protein